MSILALYTLSTHCCKCYRSELGKKEKPHLVVLPENLADSGCSTCTELRRQLSRVTEVLNDRGCANYGDLLHSKFLLEQKVSANATTCTEYNLCTSKGKIHGTENVRGFARVPETDQLYSRI